MPIVFSNDNASSYLNTLYETPAPSVSSGYLYGWGNNTIGQIGNGTSSTTYVSEPVKISDTKWKCVHINYAGSLGTENRIALDENGYLYRWGRFTGDGYVFNGTTLTPVKVNDTKWSAVAYTGKVLLMQGEDGLYGYGDPWNMTLGDPDVLWNNGTINQDSSTVETPFVVSNTKWKQLTTSGYGNIYALNEEGLLYTWGSGGIPEYDTDINGKTGNLAFPFQLSTTKWKKIIDGGDWKCVLTEDDKLYHWGYGPTEIWSATPAITNPIPLGDTKWKCIAARDTALVGINDTGDMYGVGSMKYGIFGIDSTQAQLTPMKLNNSKWKSVVISNLTIFAIDENDLLYGWGRNTNSIFGTSMTPGATQYTPLKINNLTWKQVYVGRDGVVHGLRDE